MAQLFRARIEEEKRILGHRTQYRQKFFTRDCRWDSRAFTLEMIETERIISIEGSDSQVAVITAYRASVSPPNSQVNRRRYHLQAGYGSWLIAHVDHWCPICHGQGDDRCLGCKGKRWL
jgi:hypothetical protein